MTTYWQVAAGSAGRNYSDLFIRYGIAFVGGESQDGTMAGIRKGDIIALKSGLYQILAAGEVVERNGKATGSGDKDWVRDIDGWDLPSYCYVDWHLPEKAVATDGLTRSTIQRVQQDKHKKLIDRILALPKHPFEPEPAETKEIKDDDLLEFLVDQGLRPSAANELTNTLQKIRLLARYYYYKCDCSDIREHETRSFLVVPLLLALGWAEQQIKIELPCSKGKVDIACYSEPYAQNRESCVLIVETKDFSSGLDYAPEQARRYADDFKTCQVVLVTNGYCYKAYVRQGDGSFSVVPSAYLNLLSPRNAYPLDPGKVEGALGVLRWLLPGTSLKMVK